MHDTSFFESLLSISNYFVQNGANLMIQSSVIILSGLCLAYVLKTRGAAVQSIILRSLIVAVLLCPLVSLIVGSKTVNTFKIAFPQALMKHSTTQEPLPSYDNNNSGSSQTAAATENSTLDKGTAPLKITRQPESEPAAVSHSESVSGNSSHVMAIVKNRGSIHVFLYIFLTVLWASVSIILIIRLLYYHARIFYIRQTAQDARPADLKKCKDIAHRLGVDTPIVLQSDKVESPFLTGISKPAIILPISIDVTDEIILHEIGHLVRNDCLWNLLSYIGIVILPFQPLMRLLGSLVEDTSDYVCDDFVVQYSRDSLSYANQLVSIAEKFRPSISEAVVGMGIISLKSSLLRRIKRILEDTRQILITVKLDLIVNIALFCLVITVVSGFFGFKEKGFSYTVTNSGKIINTSDGTVFSENLVLSSASIPAINGKTITDKSWDIKWWEFFNRSKVVKISQDVKIDMVTIPAGSFRMGSNKYEWDERLAHDVTIDRFSMSATEVTQHQFETVMDYNGSHFEGNENLPVEKVDWFEAVLFCNKLSDINKREHCYNEETWECDFSKNGYRLPTEAEWEYACRAGTKTLYHSGDGPEKLASAAWYNDNSAEKPHPVGQKEPNNWGLYDMHGNVWEWCNDWYDENYYQQSTDQNPPGPEHGKFRVIRGGAWNYFPYPLRSSHRGFIKPVFFYNYIGFRVVSSY